MRQQRRVGRVGLAELDRASAVLAAGRVGGGVGEVEAWKRRLRRHLGVVLGHLDLDRPGRGGRDRYAGRLLLAAAVVAFFFNDPATTEIYTLSLHDALPI